MGRGCRCPGVRRAILESYVTGPEARRLGALSHDDVVAHTLRHLEAVHPAIRQHVEGTAVKAWSRDPYALGCVSWPGPGDRDDFPAPVSRDQYENLARILKYTNKVKTQPTLSLLKGDDMFQTVSKIATAVALVVLLLVACQTTEPQPTSPELPAELRVLPEPLVVPHDQLTEEMLQREQERSTVEGALIVRYSEKEFDRIYGDIAPLEEQEWWPEASDGASPQEFLATHFAGEPYLSTMRKDEYVFTSLLCGPEPPGLDLCLFTPELGCVCFPPPEESPAGVPGRIDPTNIDIRPVSETSCRPQNGRSPCAERTGCSTGCIGVKGMAAHGPGIFCGCRDGLISGGG